MVKITAPPDKGKANAAIIALLSKALAIPKSAVSVEKGATAREKTLLLTGDANDLAKRLCALTVGKD